jgi:transcriptional regulator with XRE-family HTH domain
MLTVDQIRACLSDRNLAEVARRTGLSERTLRRYAAGKVKEPSLRAAKVLSEYLANCWEGAPPVA